MVQPLQDLKTAYRVALSLAHDPLTPDEHRFVSGICAAILQQQPGNKGWQMLHSYHVKHCVAKEVVSNGRSESTQQTLW